MLTAFAPPQIRATTGLELAAGVFTQCPMEWWSVENWSGGYWSIGVLLLSERPITPTLHHSIFFGRFSHELPIHRPAGAAYR